MALVHRLATPVAALVLWSALTSGVHAAANLLVIDAHSRWELGTSWRVASSERPFADLIHLTEGTMYQTNWEGVFALQYRPTPNLAFTAAATRHASTAIVKSYPLGDPAEMERDVLREAGWRNLSFRIERQWKRPYLGVSWRIGGGVAVCELGAACRFGLFGPSFTLAVTQDPLVWTLGLAKSDANASVSGGVDFVINSTLAVGTKITLGKAPDAAVAQLRWRQTAAIHLGRDRYVTLEWNQNLSTSEAFLAVGMSLPLGRR